jgi:hypothetical protein
LRANNDKFKVRKIVRIHRDPQAYEECEADWSLHMTDQKGEALSVLVLMQGPCEYAREMKEGVGFDRASEDELKERQRCFKYFAEVQYCILVRK